jgi:hypothetical protein
MTRRLSLPICVRPGPILWMTVMLAHGAAAQSATGPLPPLAPPAPPLPPTYWELHGTCVLASGFALLGVAAVVMWFVFQPRPPVVTPPAVAARAALTRLRGRPEDGQVLSEISRVLRQYLVAVLDLPAQELTTAEFSATLAGPEKIGAELVPAIIAFFRECDQRKFSPAAATAPLNAADQALALVAEWERQRTPATGQNQGDHHV